MLRIPWPFLVYYAARYTEHSVQRKLSLSNNFFPKNTGVSSHKDVEIFCINQLTADDVPDENDPTKRGRSELIVARRKKYRLWRVVWNIRMPLMKSLKSGRGQPAGRQVPGRACVRPGLLAHKNRFMYTEDDRARKPEYLQRVVSEIKRN